MPARQRPRLGWLPVWTWIGGKEIGAQQLQNKYLEQPFQLCAWRVRSTAKQTDQPRNGYDQSFLQYRMPPLCEKESETPPCKTLSSLQIVTALAQHESGAFRIETTSTCNRLARKSFLFFSGTPYRNLPSRTAFLHLGQQNLHVGQPVPLYFGDRSTAVPSHRAGLPSLLLTKLGRLADPATLELVSQTVPSRCLVVRPPRSVYLDLSSSKCGEDCPQFDRLGRNVLREGALQFGGMTEAA